VAESLAFARKESGLLPAFFDLSRPRGGHRGRGSTGSPAGTPRGRPGATWGNC